VGYLLRYWPTRSETFVAREVAGMAAAGIDVQVLALGEREPGGETPAVRTHWAPVGPRRAGVPLHLASAWRLGRWQRPRDLWRAAWLRRVVREQRLDRVHVHFAGEALEVAVAARLEVPVSVTVHAADLFVPRPSLPQLLRAVTVVTICEHHRRWLLEHHGVRASVVRCGIEADRYPLVDPGGPGRRVLCVARDVPKKGLDELVEAVGTVPGASLRLTSDHPRLARPWVTQGPVDRADALFARHELFALAAKVAPSGDRDGVPVALMEAMASGLPVVTTALSGIGELVDSSVGWVVPPEDSLALREALAEALGDPEARRQRGREAARRVRAGWTVAGQVEGLRRVWSAVE
jgi:glycosyltransferase involved in cell wall biosynthesis